MPLRVLLVEDSITVRQLLRELLQPPEFEIVGEAHDGQQAIDLCRDKKPDVITMDMLLPVLTGLDATEHIMAHFPTPILIVSSSFNRGELFKTYDALAAGAVDVYEKPRGDESDDQWGQGFLAALRMVSRVRVITHPRAKLSRDSWVAARAASTVDTIALGASTGGPSALVRLLNGLPVHLTIPVLVVLHLSTAFANAFLDWLAQQTSRHVAYATDGAVVAASSGRVVFAPPNYHLRVVGGRFRLSQEPEVHSCRPSVDVLFDSLAMGRANRVAACLLTGMGKDGALGLLHLRRAGAVTFAQEESSCVVYGMPREAAKLGAAQRILTVEQMALELGSLPGVTGGKP